MRIALLGTGMVGFQLGMKLVELGHRVTMGSRSRDNESAREWVGKAGEGAEHATFRTAAEQAELVINATAGHVSLDVLDSVGSEALEGKVLVDVANPIVPGSAPPELEFPEGLSLAERIQNTFPEAKVVKALNTVNARVMVEPGMLPEPTTLFICGNDDEAKKTVRSLLEEFGWERDQVLDLGMIDGAQVTERYLALWLRTMSVVGNPFFNVRLVRGG